MDEYMGVIKLFAGNFAPTGFLLCQGQLLSIAQYSALFSLLGTQYGGNGTTTFALPDLRQKFPTGTTNSAGVGVGVTGGNKTITIGAQNMPSIGSGFNLNVSNTNSNSSTPASDTYLSIPGTAGSRDFSPTLGFVSIPNGTDPKLVAINTKSITLVSPNLPVDVTPPFVTLNYIICVNGLYPSRP